MLKHDSADLAGMTLFVIAVTLLLPLTPLAGILGFTRPPIVFLLVLAMIMAFYTATAEVAKKIFYRGKS